MSSNRRSFLQQATAFTLLGRSAGLFGQQQSAGEMSHGMLMQTAAVSSASSSHVEMLHTLALAPFVDPLPLPKRIKASHATVHIAMRETRVKLHRDVPPTRIWTYEEASDHEPSCVAPVIEARSHQTLRVEWINQLPKQHFLPIDFSLHGCGRDLPEVRAVAHMHGACTPTKDDGYPTDWFVPGASRVCTYPLKQDATALWYHDHAMGLNRLNIYAGMFGMMLVRDEVEDALGLPKGKYELPLTLADRFLTADGRLYYPTSGDPDHPWVPEFSADALLVNGKISPYLEVEPRLYRLRVLNSANSRFFSLALSNNQPLHVIGSDQGLLAKTVHVPMILLAPAERADILVDFSGYAGQNVHLINGVTPLLQFRVAKAQSARPASIIPDDLRPVTPLDPSSAVVTRTITLHEIQDRIQNPMMMLINRKHWHEPVTELPKLNTTEIWEFVNLTEDTHPMHLHLVRFQVLDRRVFDVFRYQNQKELRFLAEPMKPLAHEQGWKDVVQCPPGMVTRIIVRFEGYTGKYLYHCHVLEHEANDMMRPFEVVA